MVFVCELIWRNNKERREIINSKLFFSRHVLFTFLSFLNHVRVAGGFPPEDMHKSFWLEPAGMTDPSVYPEMTGVDGGSVQFIIKWIFGSIKLHVQLNKKQINLTKDVKHVGGHDIIGKLHVDSLTEERKGSLVGVNADWDVWRCHPSTFVTRDLWRIGCPPLTSIYRPANFRCRIWRRGWALKIDSITLTCFSRTSNRNLRRWDCCWDGRAGKRENKRMNKLSEINLKTREKFRP